MASELLTETQDTRLLVIFIGTCISLSLLGGTILISACCNPFGKLWRKIDAINEGVNGNQHVIRDQYTRLDRFSQEMREMEQRINVFIMSVPSQQPVLDHLRDQRHDLIYIMSTLNEMNLPRAGSRMSPRYDTASRKEPT